MGETPNTVAVAACIGNAADLITAAKALAEQPTLTRISFHLSALALEELAKAQLLRLVASATREGREVPTIIQRALEDRGHVKRLFWAIWSQTLGRDVVNAKQIADLQGIAKHIHDTRLRGLYVDFTDDGVSIPSEAVEPRFAEGLLAMAGSLLESERAFSSDGRAMNEDERALQAWFLSSDDNPELQKLIFSGESMRKLAELGTPHKWIPWLKATWDEHERTSHEYLERELNRQRVMPETPAEGGTADTIKQKWRLRIRLITDSHSVRQKPLNDWNKDVTWIKLTATDKPRELLVDFVAPTAVGLEHLYLSGWAMARRFATALNIGSLGLFWWYTPQHVDRYYEKVIDIEAGREFQMLRNPRLAIDWPKAVLDETVLRRTMLAMSMIPEFERDNKPMPLEHYITGLTWLSKSDIHMQFEPHAFGCFYGAFRAALTDWTGDDNQLPPRERVIEAMRRVSPQFNEHDKFVDAGETFLASHRLNPMTLNDAVSMKILADLLFLKTFRNREQVHLGENANGTDVVSHVENAPQ